MSNTWKRRQAARRFWRPWRSSSSSRNMAKSRTNNLVLASRDLSRATRSLNFQSPVAYVCAPLDDAREPHERYLERWGSGQKQVLLLGMNPGPFGMAQTGVPFGDVSMVKGWLGIEGAVTKPAREHPA